MNLDIFNSIALSSGILVCFLSFIFYKFKNSIIFLDYFYYNLTAIAAFISFTMANKFENLLPTFRSIEASLNILNSIILLIFLYEIINNKEIQDRKRKILSLLILVVFFYITNHMLLKFNIIITDLIELIFVGAAYFLIFFIITKNIKNIKPEIKTNLIYIFMIIFFSFIFEWFLKQTTNISETTIYFFVFNSIGIFFLTNYFLKEFNIYHKKLSQLEPLEINNLEDIFKEFQITEREQDVAKLVLNGKSNQAIADELFITISTVKMHVYNIYKKFKVNKRADFIKLLEKNLNEKEE